MAESGDGGEGLRVWVDLANSPHPLLFAPLARTLEAAGNVVLVTAREHAQTVDLTRTRFDQFDLVDGESPGRPVAKALSLVRRAIALRRWAQRHRPDVAVSHNSYAQLVAARSLGIPAVTAMDFERQPANHLAFRLATLILLPEALPAGVVGRQGARPRKVRRYPGLKETLYLGDFDPDPGVLAKLGIQRSDGISVIVARTPPSRALYHRFQNHLFTDALEAIARQSNARCVVLPRHPEERQALKRLALPNCIVPEGAIDARSLMYDADLVLGGGGTMTREAALMGVPTLSAFAGRRPAVDRWLEDRGALQPLLSVEQVSEVHPRTSEPRPIEQLRRSGEATQAAFLEAIVATARSRA